MESLVIWVVSGPHSRCTEMLAFSQLKSPLVLGGEVPQGRYGKTSASGGVLHRMATQGGGRGVSQVGDQRQLVREDRGEKGHAYHITRTVLIFQLFLVAPSQHQGGSTIIHDY